MPPGTVFAKYDPCIFGEIQVKGETWGNDFLTQYLVDAIDCSGSDELYRLLHDAEHNGTELDMDFDCGSRDGLFDDDQLFAVFSKKDLKGLIVRLCNALSDIGGCDG